MFFTEDGCMAFSVLRYEMLQSNNRLPGHEMVAGCCNPQNVSKYISVYYVVPIAPCGSKQHHDENSDSATAFNAQLCCSFCILQLPSNL